MLLIIWSLILWVITLLSPCSAFNYPSFCVFLFSSSSPIYRAQPCFSSFYSIPLDLWVMILLLITLAHISNDSECRGGEIRFWKKKTCDYPSLKFCFRFQGRACHLTPQLKTTDLDYSQGSCGRLLFRKLSLPPLQPPWEERFSMPLWCWARLCTCLSQRHDVSTALICTLCGWACCLCFWHCCEKSFSCVASQAQKNERHMKKIELNLQTGEKPA